MALLRAERLAGIDVVIPVGAYRAWIAAESDEIDYFTIYGAQWPVHPCAVGAEVGSVELHLAPGSWGHSVHKPVGGESVGTETVDMVALSDALASITNAGIPVVAKINVEGAAGSMILGTEPSDWSAVRLLWTDVEVNDPVGLDEIIAHLTKCGMRHEQSDGQRNLFVRG